MSIHHISLGTCCHDMLTDVSTFFTNRILGASPIKKCRLKNSIFIRDWILERRTHVKPGHVTCFDACHLFFVISSYSIIQPHTIRSRLSKDSVTSHVSRGELIEVDEHYSLQHWTILRTLVPMVPSSGGRDVIGWRVVT